MSFTAHGAFCVGLACRLVVPEPLAVEASKRFWMVHAYFEGFPYSQVDCIRSISYEGTEHCLGFLSFLVAHAFYIRYPLVLR